MIGVGAPPPTGRCGSPPERVSIPMRSAWPMSPACSTGSMGVRRRSYGRCRNTRSTADVDDDEERPMESSGGIQDKPDRSRFELDVNGQVVFANYRRRGPVLMIN